MQRDRCVGIGPGKGSTVLAGRGLELLELQLQLIELAAAFGRRTEPLLPQLGDQQLEMGDERLGARCPGLRFVTRGTLDQ